MEKHHKIMMTINLTVEQKDFLQELGKQTGIPVSRILRDMVGEMMHRTDTASQVVARYNHGSATRKVPHNAATTRPVMPPPAPDWSEQ